MCVWCDNDYPEHDILITYKIVKLGYDPDDGEKITKQIGIYYCNNCGNVYTKDY